MSCTNKIHYVYDISLAIFNLVFCHIFPPNILVLYIIPFSDIDFYAILYRKKPIYYHSLVQIKNVGLFHYRTKCIPCIFRTGKGNKMYYYI